VAQRRLVAGDLQLPRGRPALRGGARREPPGRTPAP
jgi:hypothetical protein